MLVQLHIGKVTSMGTSRPLGTNMATVADTVLTQGFTTEYGVSISTEVGDWLDGDKQVDTALIGLRFQLGKDEWTDRFVIPFFGAVSLMASLVHQMIEQGHEDLALQLFREAADKGEQASVLTLLTAGHTNKSDLLREKVYPENEPTVDLVRAVAAVISAVMNDNQEASAVAIDQMDTTGALPLVSRFLATMAGRAIGYIAVMSEMSPDSVLHIIAGSSLVDFDEED